MQILTPSGPGAMLLLTWGSAPHAGSVTRGDPIPAPLLRGRAVRAQLPLRMLKVAGVDRSVTESRVFARQRRRTHADLARLVGRDRGSDRRSLDQIRHSVRHSMVIR